MGIKRAGVAVLVVLAGLSGLQTAEATPGPRLRGDVIMLPNLDDDARRCRVEPAELDAVGSEADERLAACNDAADEVVNGLADERDLARVEVRPQPGVGRNATGRLEVTGRARVFVQRDRDWVVADRLSAAELRRGVRLGVEGRDVIRPSWDGEVTITLTVTDGDRVSSASHRMRVAPLILQNDLQRATTMVAGQPGDGLGRPEGWQWMTEWEPHDWESFSADLDRAAGGTETRYIPGTELWWQDVWWQDLFEPMTATTPTQTMRVMVRSANIWEIDGVRTPRPAGRQLFNALRGPDVAVVQEWADDGRDALVDLRNATGNIESLPPYRGYPQGRLVYGTDPDGPLRPDPAFIGLLESQGEQPPVVVDTSWLLVGHADETMHVVRANNSRGWTLMVADPLLALSELRKAPGTEFFAGTPNARPVDALLGNQQVLADNAEAAAHIDAQVAIMLRETGLRAEELVRVPVLFHKPPSVGLFVAYSPGIPNGISFDERTFAAPDPHAPVVDGRDIFQVATVRALRENGVRVRWVEDLGWAHYGGGEVHCTTNAWRDTSGQRPWWTD